MKMSIENGWKIVSLIYVMLRVLRNKSVPVFVPSMSVKASMSIEHGDSSDTCSVLKAVVQNMKDAGNQSAMEELMDIYYESIDFGKIVETPLAYRFYYGLKYATDLVMSFENEDSIADYDDANIPTPRRQEEGYYDSTILDSDNEDI
jgi:hypothetical protein